MMARLHPEVWYRVEAEGTHEFGSIQVEKIVVLVLAKSIPDACQKVEEYMSPILKIISTKCEEL